MPITALLMLWAFKSITTPIVHPDAQQIPATIASAPSQKWADAVHRGQQIMRAGLVDQNLPGLSVAVGTDGDIVWAEGFGYVDIEKKTTVNPDTGFRVADAS